METLGAIIGVAVLVLLAVYNIRRRARMTPEQRHQEDMLRETRAVKRELRRRNYE